MFHKFPWANVEFRSAYQHTLEINLVTILKQCDVLDCSKPEIIDFLFSNMSKAMLKSARDAERSLGIFSSSGRRSGSLVYAFPEIRSFIKEIRDMSLSKITDPLILASLKVKKKEL